MERSETDKKPWTSARVTLSFETTGDRDFEPETPNINASYNPTENSISIQTNTELTIALREAFVISGNLIAPDVNFWIGKRFYRRKDIHILDFYYLDSSGPGLGIEDLPTGLGKLHIALFRNNPLTAGPAQTTLDFRWTDLNLGIGSLESVFLYSYAGTRDAFTGRSEYEAIDGYSIQFIFSYILSPTGTNSLIFQYGHGLLGANGAWGSSLLDQRGGWGSQNIAKDNIQVKNQRSGSSTVRLIDHFVFENFLDRWSAEIVALYQDVDFNSELNGQGQKIPNKTEMTYGLRPIYHASDRFSIALEVGYSTVNNGIYDQEVREYRRSELSKITLAPLFMPGTGYWFRPQFRFFLTYAEWNEASRGLVASNSIYESDTSGYSIGAQVEAWW
jgi:maltoporin